VLIVEAAKTKFIVLGLTQPGIELMNYYTKWACLPILHRCTCLSRVDEKGSDFDLSVF